MLIRATIISHLVYFQHLLWSLILPCVPRIPCPHTTRNPLKDQSDASSWPIRISWWGLDASNLIPATHAAIPLLQFTKLPTPWAYQSLSHPRNLGSLPSVEMMSTLAGCLLLIPQVSAHCSTSSLSLYSTLLCVFPSVIIIKITSSVLQSFNCKLSIFLKQNTKPIKARALYSILNFKNPNKCSTHIRH